MISTKLSILTQFLSFKIDTQETINKAYFYLFTITIMFCLCFTLQDLSNVKDKLWREFSSQTLVDGVLFRVRFDVPAVSFYHFRFTLVKFSFIPFLSLLVRLYKAKTN